MRCISAKSTTPSTQRHPFLSILIWVIFTSPLSFKHFLNWFAPGLGRVRDCRNIHFSSFVLPFKCFSTSGTLKLLNKSDEEVEIQNDDSAEANRLVFKIIRTKKSQNPLPASFKGSPFTKRDFDSKHCFRNCTDNENRSNNFSRNCAKLYAWDRRKWFLVEASNNCI